MTEPPLTQNELRIVRGMIDEYRFDQERGRERRAMLKHWQIVGGIATGLLLVVLQLLQLYFNMRYR